jgi:GxxExxY protein
MNTDQKRTTDQKSQQQTKAQGDLGLERGRFSGLHSDVTDRILKVFYEVFNELGCGFLESVYHKAFTCALRQAGLTVSVEVAVPVFFRGEVVGDFRADMIVNDNVLLELKAQQALDHNHEAQVLNYLRATHIEVALLLNFGPKPQFKRFLLDNVQKKIRVHPCESVVGFLEGANR